MTTVPVIGILGNRLPAEEKVLFGLERDYVNHDYVHAVEHSGGIPLIIPIVDETDFMRSYCSIIDGLIVSGGYDVHPLLFGQEPSQLLDYSDITIDSKQLKLMECAYTMDKPILGICKGFQLLHVMLGGTLFQDISLACSQPLAHKQRSLRDRAHHTVNFTHESMLYRAFGAQADVNSLHHMCIDRPGKHLRTVGRTSDGIIEASEHDEPGSCVIGVQWHPEMMFDTSCETQELFRLFIERSSEI